MNDADPSCCPRQPDVLQGHMRRIIYTSFSTGAGARVELDGILEQSRHNNAIDGVTGLLWSDGTCFMQVLEGPEESVVAAFSRIQADPRHHELTVLEDTGIAERTFGYWSMEMAEKRASAASYDDLLRYVLRNSASRVSDRFMAMLERT